MMSEAHFKVPQNLSSSDQPGGLLSGDKQDRCTVASERGIISAGWTSPSGPFAWQVGSCFCAAGSPHWLLERAPCLKGGRRLVWQDPLAVAWNAPEISGPHLWL